MTISLFFGDAARSFLIRSRSVPQGRGMDSYGEVSRRQEAEGKGLQYSLGCFSTREAARSQPVLGNLAPEVADKINNLVGLNAANLQLATYEVFHVRS
jgi:hypothetical protein